MAKGLRERFKVLIRPDRTKRTWLRNALEEAKSLDAILRPDLDRQLETFKFLVAKSLFIEGAMSEAKEHAPSLDEKTLVRVIGAVYDSFKARHERGASHRMGRSSSFEMEVDPGEVRFSVTENMVNVPGLGTVPFKKNKNITVSPRIPNASDNKAWLLANIRRMSLIESAGDVYLIIDCSEPSEDEERIKKKNEKAKGKAKKKRGSGINWFEEPKKRRPGASGDAGRDP